MKILQVSNRVPWPLNEGGTIGIYNFTRAFAEAGHEVTLYCLDALKHRTPQADAKRELKKYCKEVYFHTIDTEIKVSGALKDLLGGRSYNVSRFDNESFADKLLELLQKNSYDVIQLEGTFTGPYLQLLRNHHQGLLVLRMHNVEYEIWERLARNTSNPIKKQYLQILSKQLKKYEKDLLPIADLITTVTQEDKDKFQILSPNSRIEVIPAGIDTEYWHYNPTGQWTKWYHLGSLEWAPNREAAQWFADDIYPELRKISPIQFHLAGKGLDSSMYELHPGMTMYPSVADAARFVQPMDVCVVPLKSGSGIRLKILEAMAAGKLVISTTIGAQGIDAIPGKHILIADTVDDFKKILSDLKNNEINANEIVKNARALIEEKYSIDAVSKKLMQFFEQAQEV
ncbi:glycosyltransferase [bacterium]|nr:glycosyltransferase [bacterium]